MGKNSHAKIYAPSQLYQLLWNSAAQGRRSRIKVLLEEPNEVDASAREHKIKSYLEKEGLWEDRLESLLGTKVHVDAENGKKEDALTLASRHGHKRIVELLVKHGARIKNGHPLIAASAGAHEAVVALLLNRGAKVDAKENDSSALLEAASKGYKDVVQLLLEVGADTYIANRYGETPLELAARSGYKDVIELLLTEDANTNATANCRSRALCEASSQGHEEAVKLLLDCNADIDTTSSYHHRALCEASRSGHEKVVELLLNHKTTINGESRCWYDALIAASNQGHEGVVRLLLNKDAKREGLTGNALHEASGKGHEKVVELLLKHCINIKTRTMLTCIDLALKKAFIGEHKGVVEVLLEHGTDADIVGISSDCQKAVRRFPGSTKLEKLHKEHARKDSCKKSNKRPCDDSNGRETSNVQRRRRR